MCGGVAPILINLKTRLEDAKEDDKIDVVDDFVKDKLDEALIDINKFCKKHPGMKEVN